MKLPENRKERIQILVLIAIGVVGALYMGIQLGIKPMMDTMAKSRERLDDLTIKIAQAELYTGQVGRKDRQNDDLVAELRELSKTHILEDEVGNFLLPAEAILKRLARGVGIQELDVRQVGFAMLPQPPTSTQERPFKAYGVRATAMCGYEKAIEFVRAMQEANPYLAISGVHITAVANSPETHQVVFDVRWPVWSSEDLKQTVLNPPDPSILKDEA